MAAAGRLSRAGLIVATEGNLSVRLDDGTLLVTPAGRRKDEVRPDDLVVVDPETGAAVGPGRPSSDLAIHLAVHRARPDIVAVAHAHLPASMALTVAGETPDPSILPETAHFLGRLPVVPFGEMGSLDLATRIAAALVEPPEPLPVAAVLERHGAIAVATTPDTAVAYLELVEVLCRTWRDALLVRAARATLGDEGLIPLAPPHRPADAR